MKRNKLLLSAGVSVLVIILLSVVQLKVARPMLLAERFVDDAGWVEIITLSLYAAFLMYNMLDKSKQKQFRIYSWAVFSIVFFTQLILGLSGVEQCLMTGNLHLPVPAMIIGGPLYRAEISFMTILFLSTVLLAGPAWCSQFCYFGAIDGLASKRKNSKPINHLWKMKWVILLLVVLVSILARIFNVSAGTAAWVGGIFGVIGVLVIVILSARMGAMVNCIVYCPVGTVVSVLKVINPIKITVSPHCTLCMKCVPECKYNALDITALKNGKPQLHCTNCGDCVSACKTDFIYYKLGKLNPNIARNVYLFITVSIHVVFLGLARI